MSKNANEPAYGYSYERASELGPVRVADHYKGLTKRELIAAMAMQTIPPPQEFVGKEQTEASYRLWAEDCVKMADALLKQLEK